MPTNYKRSRVQRRRGTAETTVALAAKLAKMRMANKSKSNSKTAQIKRRKTKVSKSGYGELSTTNYTSGKVPRHTLKGAWKLLTANAQKNTYASYYCNRYMTNALQPGNIQINFAFAGSNLSGPHTQPLNIHPISACPNITNGSVNAQPGLYTLRKSDITTTAYPSFITGGGMYLNNTAGAAGGVQSYPGQTDILKSVNIKLCLYGTVTRPTSYLIQMVQFRKPYLHPDYINNVVANSGSPIAEPEMQKAGAFYEELTKKFMYNPISFTDNTQVKDMKVLKTWKYVMQPALSTERVQIENETGSTNSQMPHSKIVQIYHRFNRRQNYNWDQSTEGGVSVGNTQDNYPANYGQNRNDVTYNARIYLMIRALSPVSTLSGGFDSQAQPSYDLSMRLYHENLG